MLARIDWRLLRSALLLAAMLMSWPVAAIAGEEFTGWVARNTDELPRNGEGSMLVLEDGRLLLVYTEWYAGEGGDNAPARLVAVTSSDVGRNWSEPRIVQDNVGEMNVMSASLVRTATGRILLIYIKKDSRQQAAIWFKQSDDEGATWSPMRSVSDLDDQGYVVAVNDCARRLASGRIVIPVYRSPSVWDEREHFVSYCYVSKDNGQSWQRSQNTVDCPKRGAMEPVVFEKGDGGLLMLIRTQMGKAFRAESADGGLTWSAAVASEIVHPEAPIQVRPLPDGKRALLVWNNAVVPGADHQGPRRPLSLATSSDDGATWQHLKNVESAEEGSYCYVSTTFHAGQLLMTYYAPEGLKFRAVEVGLGQPID